MNLQVERSRLADLREHRIFSLPVVAVGDRFLGSPKLHEIDVALGIASDAEQLLPGPELLARARALLAAASRFARQLPPDHYEDPTPGAEDSGPLILPDGTEVLLPDGRPYMPHATSIGLVRHIVGHGVKVLLLVSEPASDLFASAARFGPLGEPDDSVPLEGIVAEADRVRALLLDATPELDRVVLSYMGQRTIHELVQAMTYSLAQHTRQLEDVLATLGIEPDTPLTDADYRGLGLPETVWQ